jgi:hypothetical protein
MNIEQDRFTRILERCVGLRIRGKSFKVNDLVAREGVEPPTPAFSGLRTTSVSPLSFNNLTLQSGPQFCDHSVTSADVRLSVGPNLSRAACQRPVDSPPVPGVDRCPIRTQIRAYFRLARDSGSTLRHEVQIALAREHVCAWRYRPHK